MPTNLFGTNVSVHTISQELYEVSHLVSIRFKEDATIWILQKRKEDEPKFKEEPYYWSMVQQGGFVVIPLHEWKTNAEANEVCNAVLIAASCVAFIPAEPRLRWKDIKEIQLYIGVDETELRQEHLVIGCVIRAAKEQV